jgi:hypothetical protein
MFYSLRWRLYVLCLVLVKEEVVVLAVGVEVAILVVVMGSSYELDDWLGLVLLVDDSLC